MARRNRQPLPVNAPEIHCLILTHAHDHCGWIPRLVKQGFRGPIYATLATIDPCGILLPDSGHLQEEDAAFHNRKKTSRHRPALLLYTMEEAQASMQYFQAVEFGERVQICPEFSFSLCACGTHSGIIDGPKDAVHSRISSRPRRLTALDRQSG